MAFLIGGANTLDDAYDISNSIRYNSANSAYFNRTTGSPTNEDMVTISVWLKRTDVGNNNTIMSWNSGNGSQAYVRFANSSDNVQLYNQTASETATSIITNSEIKDPAAWYHLVIQYDAAQGTASNRVKIYLNNVLQTLGTANYPPQNTALALNVGSRAVNIGRWAAGSEYYNGYMAEFHYLDGVIKDPDDFGKTDANGVWIPKEYTGGSYGNNGFFLEFKQTGTSANSSGKGADTSGNDNHFDDNSMDAHDITTDSPTNNYCTMNPLYKAVTGSTNQMTYKNGALRVEGGSDSSSQSTFGLANGKWYWEVNYGQAVANRQGYPQIGVSKAGNVNNGQMVGFHTPSGSDYRGKIAGTTVANAFDGSPAQSDKIGFYLDLDNGTLIVHQNGSDFMGSGASSGLDFSSTSFSPDTGFFHIHINDNTDSTTISEVNFGNPPFSVSSSNADANGYGSFEHSPTLGGTAYYAINSKNLAEYG